MRGASRSSRVPVSCRSRRPFARREPRLGRRTLAPIVNPSVDRMQPEYGWREVSGGVNAAGNQWLAYSGMTLAPWSSDIYSDGWRLRVGGGYGQYSYDRGIPISGECGTLPDCSCRYRSDHVRVDHSYAEALVGYYLRLGQLTVKAFAGASMSSERHEKSGLKNKSDGTEYGAKGCSNFGSTWAPRRGRPLISATRQLAMKRRRAGGRAGASSRDCRSDPSCATTRTLNRATASRTAAPAFSPAMRGMVAEYRRQAA